ncbi:MAG: rhomboid family intramembrane serine protease [Candidatus Metalachnospira sp.]|nr:rhomboid family intramembrane serine protease [Candidatus Metalachnospira sp.]
MFQKFLRSITGELSKKQFKLLTVIRGSNDEEISAIFVKDESPVFYMASISDFDSIIPEELEKLITESEENILKANRHFFNNIVSVNILYSENAERAEAFVNSRDIIRDNGIHNVWWYTDGAELYYGQGQPTKVFEIEKSVKKALENDFYGQAMNLEEISRNESEKTRLRKKSKFPVTIAAIMTANILIFLAQLVLGAEDEFIYRYGINQSMIFLQGQYYRIFTYMFIHSGIEHIMFNGLSLFIYGTRVEKYCGNLKTAAIYFISGLSGGLLSAGFNTGFCVGASGAIFGLLGAVLVISKKTGQKLDGLGYTTMLAVAVVSIGMGMLDAGVDNFGHIGGFIGGLISSALIYRSKKE